MPVPTTRGEGIRIHSFLVIVPLLGLTLLLMSLIFAPLNQWYLAYFCMVPWLIVLGGCDTARRAYIGSWLLGFVFFLINMWWMEAPTGMGYIAASAYLACYFPLAACPIRHVVRRRGWPLAVAFPLMWVGVEYVRGLLLSGFPWFFLAHSHHQILSMIQISDLVGAYGVTFVLAAVNGAIADVIFARYSGVRLRRGRAPRRSARFSVIIAATLVVLTFGYGQFQLHRDTSSPGPRIAVLQQDYPNFTNPDRERVRPAEKARAYFSMLTEAEREKPDLFLFPETAWWMYLNKDFRELDEQSSTHAHLSGIIEWSRQCFKLFQDWSRETGAAIVVGSASVTVTPLSLRQDDIRFNSAYCFTPDGREPQRHDKIHPVLLGEYVPFRYGRLRFLYLWLNSLSPFGQDGFEYSLTPGEDVHVFEATARNDPSTTYRFGVPICYEDVMPYVCRRFVAGKDGRKRVDFLFNISNDGWFLYRNELPQHFAICVFRAVENRVGIARAVNTGISGFIDPNGRTYDTIGPGQVGYKVAPVMKDTRVSLYSRTGDVLALLCALACVPLYLDYIVMRARSGGREDAEIERSK